MESTEPIVWLNKSELNTLTAATCTALNGIRNKLLPNVDFPTSIPKSMNQSTYMLDRLTKARLYYMQKDTTNFFTIN